MEKILVDNSVMSFGATGHGITVPIPDMVNRLLLVQAKPVRKEKETWLKRQIECLPTVGRLAREGGLSLHTYDELLYEAMARRDALPRELFGNVFADVEINHVAPPVRRGVFWPGDLFTHVKKGALAEFCRWLIDSYSEKWLQGSFLEGILTQEEIANLNNIEQFRSICHSLSEAQYADGYHLWAGEVNGLSYFLTIDRKFTNALKSNCRLKTRCIPICPSDLLEVLGIEELEPLPFEFGRRYYLSGRPYD